MVLVHRLQWTNVVAIWCKSTKNYRKRRKRQLRPCTLKKASLRHNTLTTRQNPILRQTSDVSSTRTELHKVSELLRREYGTLCRHISVQPSDENSFRQDSKSTYSRQTRLNNKQIYGTETHK